MGLNSGQPVWFVDQEPIGCVIIRQNLRKA